MKPPAREEDNMDFLAQPFLVIPYELIEDFPNLHVRPEELLVLLQILAALQIERNDFLEPQEIGQRCGLDELAVHGILERLQHRGFLSIGSRLHDNGTESQYFDLTPLWQRLRKVPIVEPTLDEPSDKHFEVNLVSVFERELGRPLSSLECDQLRVWLTQDGYAQWLIVEALREAIYANKYSIKYIDAVLYDWQKHRILSKPELEQYRQSIRERKAGRKQVASTSSNAKGTSRNDNAGRDERYENFYKLFPNG